MDERILTLHPRGKSGVNISKTKYDLVRTAILESLADGRELTFSQLRDTVEQKLEGVFEGSISWFYTTVKLDLEARGEIKRASTSGPQRIRLADSGAF